jgi:Rhs element Vgr protein
LVPAERTLPIAAEHREITVKVSGDAVGRQRQLVSTTILKQVNKVSSARLVYLDGAPSSGDFPLANADTFLPGAEVEILAGTTDDPASLFKGIVVKQSIKVRQNSAAQLVVECRHAAVKLTVGKRSACFFDQTDSDTISGLLGDASVDADVTDTSTTHKQQVQFRSTDWEFLLARAKANGAVVLTNDEKVVVKPPPTSGESVATLTFGATILEMDAQIDARQQFSAMKAITWDPSAQELVEKEAADPSYDGPGNVAPRDLADVVGLSAKELRHAALDETEAQAWADGAWKCSRLNKVSGRVKCEGIAAVNPGDFITLSGVGERYGGDVLVTGVRHEADQVQGWKTHIQFGSIDPDADEDRAQPGLVPNARGLQIGVVTSNEDEDGEHRVRVKLPLVDNEGDGVWARVASPDAGDERGFFFRPEIGDEVVIGFLEEDPRGAVILGMLHSSAHAAPLEGSDDNHEKVYQSRSKMKLYFDDDKKVMSFETPGGNKIRLSEEDKAITIEDQNGNKIELTADGIKLDSAKALQLKAATDCKIEATSALEGKGGDVKLTAQASAELSSSATTTVKGGMVKIN